MTRACSYSYKESWKK